MHYAHSVYHIDTQSSEEVAAVKVGGKWGYIDAIGRMVINPQFDDEPGFFSRGIAAVGRFPWNGTNLYINKKGGWVYPSVSAFQNDFMQMSPLLLAHMPKANPSGTSLIGEWTQCVSDIGVRPICYEVRQGDPTQYGKAIYRDRAAAERAAKLQFDVLVFEHAGSGAFFAMKTTGQNWAQITGYDVPFTEGGDTSVVYPGVDVNQSSQVADTADVSGAATYYSDLRIDVQSVTQRPHYEGCIIRARIHNKTSYLLSTVMINATGYDKSGTLTETATFVFHDVPAFGDSEKDMAGFLRTIPANVKIVDVQYP